MGSTPNELRKADRHFCYRAAGTVVLWLVILGGGCTMVAFSAISGEYYNSVAGFEEVECTLWSGYVNEGYDVVNDVYHISADFNASFIKSETLVWGIATEELRSSDAAQELVDAIQTPAKHRCFYDPGVIDFERSSQNVFMLQYFRDEEFGKYVGLSVAGSFLLVGTVGALIYGGIRCCKKKEGMPSVHDSE
eukprot:TRINITY_DN3693_c0_g1_i1.p1 TRINITY_DN3693_c0_g1~~TRINITY_DN3693_c0_g1_i1.p1  ORF type:complete len:192 (+),score=18.78 TRINITY_DN3693_c0_g1_i1:300-875(+)